MATDPRLAYGPIVFTPRLIIRPITLDDMDHMVQILSMEEVIRWTSADPNNAVAWLTKRCKPPAFNCAIHLRKRSDDNASSSVGDFIGILGSREPPRLGYMLDVKAHGKGYATEAVAGFEELYFATAPSAFPDGKVGASVGTLMASTPQPAQLSEMAEHLQSGPTRDYLEAHVDHGNLGSKRVAEKRGFTLVDPAFELVDGEKKMLTLRYVKPRPGLAVADVGFV